MKYDRRPETMERITTPELAQAFIDDQIAEIRAQVGDKKVLLALSGGVDSSVVAALLIKAICQQLVCVHVNHGLLRKGEPEQVIEVFRNQMNANLIYVDATDRSRGRGLAYAARVQSPAIVWKLFVNPTRSFAKSSKRTASSIRYGSTSPLFRISAPPVSRTASVHLSGFALSAPSSPPML